MGKTFTSDKPSISEIRRLKKPNRKEVTILLDSGLKAEIDAKTQEIDQLTRARTRGKSLADKSPERAQAELDTLMEAAEGSSVTFLFQDIGKKRLDDLITAHPPTDEQKALYKAEENPGVLAYNLETFPPALISTVCIDPDMSYDDAQAICDEWGGGDVEALFMGALAACKERTSIPLYKLASAATPVSDLSSTSALSTEESPTPNSSSGKKKIAPKPSRG